MCTVTYLSQRNPKVVSSCLKLSKVVPSGVQFQFARSVPTPICIKARRSHIGHAGFGLVIMMMIGVGQLSFCLRAGRRCRCCSTLRSIFTVYPFFDGEMQFRLVEELTSSAFGHRKCWCSANWTFLVWLNVVETWVQQLFTGFSGVWNIYIE